LLKVSHMNLRRSLPALLFVFALASPAAADDPSDADRATARALTLEGYNALDRKDYPTAVDRFRRADSLYHVPTVALGLANAEIGIGKLVNALATYSRIVREGVPAKAPPAFAKAVADARKALDALTPRIPSVIITVRGPSDAKVTIDGADVPAAALEVKRPVDPGAHVVRATAPGCTASEVTLTLLEGKAEAVTLELKLERPEVAAAPVVPPPVVVPPPPVVTPPPLPPVMIPVMVPTPVAPPPPEAGTSTQKVLGFVGLGLGAAGLGAGAVTGGLALARHGSLVETCPQGSCKASQRAAVQADLDAYHTLGTVSTAGFIAGGALLGTGVILLLTAPKASPSREARVTPMIGLGYAGAKGSF
jgi:hypothetical protein